MLRRILIVASLSLAAFASGAVAQETVKIGMSVPLTGAGFNAVGRQVVAGARLYVQQHGDQVAGKKIELVIRDDAGVADTARRLVQEMIVNEKVSIIGASITPTALAIAQLVTQAKIATVDGLRCVHYG
jgi:branched-chain amino acid transport system substrate-binding protein